MTSEYKHLVPIGPGFWNLRGSFKVALGLVDIGTHMSFAQLSDGRFLVIDTIPLTPESKKEVDHLTDNGSKIAAVIGTHPYHTMYFRPFFSAYPTLQYYGTPRHLRVIPDIPWAGDVNEESVRGLWEPDVSMRIPAGSEFVNPLPEKSNHFSNVFVYHRPSRTVHNDDTIIFSHNPGFLMRLIGFTEGKMIFHPSIKGPGLYPTPESVGQFKCWLQKLLADWPIENLCTAHNGNKVGGAGEAIRQLLESSEDMFAKIFEKKKSKTGGDENAGAWSKEDKDGCECG